MLIKNSRQQTNHCADFPGALLASSVSVDPATLRLRSAILFPVSIFLYRQNNPPIQLTVRSTLHKSSDSDMTWHHAPRSSLNVDMTNCKSSCAAFFFKSRNRSVEKNGDCPNTCKPDVMDCMDNALPSSSKRLS